MKKLISLYLIVILSFSLFSQILYAKDTSTLDPKLRQPKLTADYTGTQVSLSIDTNGNAYGHEYLIQRSPSPDMTTDCLIVQDWSCDLVEADVVLPNEIYYYRTKLRTKNGGESLWSDIIKVDTSLLASSKNPTPSKPLSAEELFITQYKDMSPAEKYDFANLILNNLPYTMTADELNPLIRNLAANSQMSLADKEVFAINPLIFNTLGYNDYRLFDTQTPTSKPIFSDLPSTHWAYPSVKSLYFYNIVDGYNDGTYRPHDKVTLAQALVFLDRTVKNHPTTSLKRPRSETQQYVPLSDSWAYYHIASIASKVNTSTLAIINVSDYNKPITKETFAQLIYSLTNNALPTTVKYNKYYDLNTSKYPQALRYCLGVGIIQGDSSPYISPHNELTRAELAVMLSRLNEALLQYLEH